MSYTLGSLFDGSGGFPLAGSMCGFTPLWAAEVEPYPIAVTRSRFPEMRHLGDISKINGAEIPPVDVITFGSPCQDLSVAGKRAGLKHEDNGDEETTRSGLFMEAVRIIKEMREATNGRYPTFALWENVPGAFSSNRGEDFRLVLEELIKIVEPCATVPPAPKGGWPYADTYMGAGWSLAYRVFDAQYWGVPQRRRRIHLVVDFGGERAREVLFEREGLRGYFAESRTPWQAPPSDAEGSVGAYDREGDGVIAFAQNQREEVRDLNNVAVALNAEPGTHQQTFVAVPDSERIKEVLPFDTTQVTSPQNGNNPKWGDPCHPLAAQGHPPTLVCKVARSIENHPADSRVNIDESGKVQTLTSRMGTGGGNVPMVMESVYCLQGNGIDRTDTAGCNGRGWNDKTCYTLNTIDRPAVAYKEVRYIVRRLTPTECARLQGFADRWGDIEEKTDFTDEEYHFWLDVRNTHAAINGKAVKDYTKAQMLAWYNKLHTDAAEYKMWGNGIALPPALYCMQGIVDALEGVRGDG